MSKLAIVLIRGIHDLEQDKLTVLKMLNIGRKNVCVIVEDTPSNKGLINKIKDYIAWGEIDEDTLKLLIEKRGEKNPEDPKKTKPFFRLNNPKGGFERKGIKWPFTKGGALGYRGSKINNLIKRMA
ncbi:uL30 family ribosomal protein [Nanoarchaeota archaeon]